MNILWCWWLLFVTRVNWVWFSMSLEGWEKNWFGLWRWELGVNGPCFSSGSWWWAPCSRVRLSLSLLDPCIFEWQLKEACFTGHASFYLIIFTLPFGTLTLGCTQALFLCSINLLIIIVFPLEPCEFPNLLCIGIPIYQTCSKPDIMGSYGNLTFLISISFGTKNCVSSILIS